MSQPFLFEHGVDPSFLSDFDEEEMERYAGDAALADWLSEAAHEAAMQEQDSLFATEADADYQARECQEALRGLAELAADLRAKVERGSR